MSDLNDKLLPCPFCGGPADIQNDFGRVFWVQCVDLDCASTDGTEWRKPAEAVAHWNRRATPAPQATPSDEMTVRVDAAMTAMRGISPPLRRSECEQLIRAALAASPAVTQAATSEPVASIHTVRGEKQINESYAAVQDLPDGTLLYAGAAPVAAPLPSSDARDGLLKKAQAVIAAFERAEIGSDWEDGNGTNIGRKIAASLKSYRAALAAATQSTEKP